MKHSRQVQKTQKGSHPTQYSVGIARETTTKLGAHCFQPPIEEREEKAREVEVKIGDLTMKMEREMTARTIIGTM